MKPVQCPTCDLRWNIPDEAPPVITCPRCLAALMNPYPSTDPRYLTGKKPPPLPVMPLESQVRADKRTSNAGLMVLIVVIVAGVFTFFIAVGNGASVSIESIIGLVIIAAAALIPIFVIANKKHTPIPALPVGNFDASVQPGGVLNYSRPISDPRRLSGGAFFAQCIGGIILGIVGGAFVMGALSSFANGAFAFGAIGVPIAVGAFLCTKPRVRGLGVGLILALPAAFLLLLGFCAIILSGSSFH